MSSRAGDTGRGETAEGRARETAASTASREGGGAARPRPARERAGPSGPRWLCTRPARRTRVPADSGGRHRLERAQAPGVGQRRGARAGEPGKARTHVSAPQAETAAQGPRRVSGRVGTRPTLHAARGATWGEQGRPVFGARGEVVPKCSVTKICKQTAKCAKVNTTLKACRRPYVNILKKVGE